MEDKTPEQHQKKWWLNEAIVLCVLVLLTAGVSWWFVVGRVRTWDLSKWPSASACGLPSNRGGVEYHKTWANVILNEHVHVDGPIQFAEFECSSDEIRRALFRLGPYSVEHATSLAEDLSRTLGLTTDHGDEYVGINIMSWRASLDHSGFGPASFIGHARLGERRVRVTMRYSFDRESPWVIDLEIR